jgi:hypothetical protein
VVSEASMTFDYADVIAEQRRRMADAVITQEMTLQLLKYSYSKTDVLRVARQRMVRELRRLGVTTPVYFVAYVNPKLRLLCVSAFAGRNRVTLGRNWRGRQRDPATWWFQS